MNKNDILRRIQYVFDFSDSKMISIFNQADQQVTRAQISDWLKKMMHLPIRNVVINSWHFF